MSILSLMIWALIILVFLGIGYVSLTLKKLSTPTKGRCIDRASRPQEALLVIDMQEDFTRNSGKHAYADEARDAALEQINRRIADARQTGKHVVFIKNVFRDAPVIWAMKLTAGGIGTPGREGLRLDRSLDIKNAPVFEKAIGDSFSNNELEEWLEHKQIGELELVGLDACHCVQLTAKGALQRGYTVKIPETSLLTTSPAKWGRHKADLINEGAAFA